VLKTRNSNDDSKYHHGESLDARNDGRRNDLQWGRDSDRSYSWKVGHHPSLPITAFVAGATVLANT